MGCGNTLNVENEAIILTQQPRGTGIRPAMADDLQDKPMKETGTLFVTPGSLIEVDDSKSDSVR